MFYPHYKGQPMFFVDEPWEIHFEDYNHDGQIDFNLGQYGGCNGWRYKLFTISTQGIIMPLNIYNKRDGVFISDRQNSTEKLEVQAVGFSHGYYDNSIGGGVEETYSWSSDDERFVPRRKMESVINGKMIVVRHYEWDSEKEGYVLIEEEEKEFIPNKAL